MSLLLEALKKAELAKQQGMPSASGEPASTAPIEFDSSAASRTAPTGADQPLITRDRLPDITQPLEILSEDLPSAGAAPRRDKASPAASGEPSPTPRATAAERAAATAEQDRAAVRQAFEAKAADYEPRRAFFYALGIVGLLATGVAGYFAYQLFAPRPSFYTGPPGGKSATAAATPATSPPSPAPSVSASQTAAPPPSSGLPREPDGTPAEPAPGAPPPAGATASGTEAAGAGVALKPPPVPPQAVPPAARRPVEPAPRQVAPASSKPTRQVAALPRGEGEVSGGPPRSPVRVTRVGPRVEPAVERGWRALQAGDLALARDEYARALRANPTDRDALLGLAAIDVRAQDFESAEARYVRVLELDPRDAYAHAALASLRGQADGTQTESRLKSLAAQQPDAAVLSFALGNQYAAQRRWDEAQQAYFRAFSSDPDNPDYAYNLAVSLDQLRQPQLALEYYQRALALAGRRTVGFNPVQVESRVRELQR